MYVQYVQCGSLGCSVAQLVARWLAVRQARVRISARHPMEVPPTEPTAVKIWRWASANVYVRMMYECIYCIKTNKCKKSGIRPPNLYV
jgi:hypothetical protein